MANNENSIVRSLRGSLRLYSAAAPSAPAAAPAQIEAVTPAGILPHSPTEKRATGLPPDLEEARPQPLQQRPGHPSEAEPSWLSDSRKLIPGEALAGYLSLQPISKLATNKENVSIVLGLVFLLVTILLRWIGSQDPDAPAPEKTSQWAVVVISSLSFIFHISVYFFTRIYIRK